MIKHSKLVSISSGLLMLSSGILTSGSALAADSYDIVEINNLGGNPVFVYSVNSSGVAVGHSAGPIVDKLDENGNVVLDADGNPLKVQDFGSHAFSFQNGVTTDLGAVDNGFTGIDHSAAFAINNNGIAAGSSIKQFSRINPDDGLTYTAIYEQAALFDTNTQTFTLLPNIDLLQDKEREMRALSLNDNNVVVGYADYDLPNDTNEDGSENTTAYARGFIYNPITSTIDLVHPLTTDVNMLTSLRDINNNGIATGWSHKIDGKQTLVSAIYVDMTTSDVVNELTLFTNSHAYPWAINDDGKIVGKAVDATKKYFTAFVYDINTQEATDMGVLNPIAPSSEAYDINNNGQIVGLSLYRGYPATNHAFIYENGVMTDLNDLIDCKVDTTLPATGSPDWELHAAYGISDTGIIVGIGVLGGLVKPFMLTPRPGVEPILCQNDKEESGGGSFPVSLLILLTMLPLTRRNYKQ